MMVVKTIWELCLFQVGPAFCLTLEVANGIFSFLTERDWSRNSCYGNSTKGAISFRGIEWSLRALANMRAVRLFLRARAEIKYVLRAPSTLKKSDSEQ